MSGRGGEGVCGVEATGWLFCSCAVKEIGTFRFLFVLFA